MTKRNQIKMSLWNLQCDGLEILLNSLSFDLYDIIVLSFYELQFIKHEVEFRIGKELGSDFT